jgi:hypothetical protein
VQWGIRDRGTLQVGKAADLVLLDLDALENGIPRFVDDMPGGASRYTRDAKGYGGSDVPYARTGSDVPYDHTGSDVPYDHVGSDVPYARTRAYAHSYARTHSYTHAYTHILKRTHIPLRTHILTDSRMLRHSYTHTHIHTHTHSYTLIHTHAPHSFEAVFVNGELMLQSDEYVEGAQSRGQVV